MEISTWGKMGLGRIRVRGDVGASIARRHGLIMVTCREDVREVCRQCGNTRSVIFQGTLGSRIARRYGGGYSVSGQVWWSEPRNGCTCK